MINTEESNLSVINDFTGATDINISHYGFERLTPEKAFVSANDGYHSYRLHFIAKGSMFFHVGVQKTLLNKNTFFILRPNSDLGFSVNPKNLAEHYWCTFSGILAERIIGSLFSDEKFYCIVSPAMRTKILQCFTENFDYKAPSLRKNILYTKNLYTIFQMIANENTSVHTLPTKVNPDNIITYSLAYINENFTDPDMSVATVADYIHISKGYYSNAFSKKMKIPFSQYITQKRIEHAITLIRSGKTNVSEIAYASGFNDPLYFSKVFKKLNNISPKKEIEKTSKRNETKLRS